MDYGTDLEEASIYLKGTTTKGRYLWRSFDGARPQPSATRLYVPEQRPYRLMPESRVQKCIKCFIAPTPAPHRDDTSTLPLIRSAGRGKYSISLQRAPCLHLRRNRMHTETLDYGQAQWALCCSGNSRAERPNVVTRKSPNFSTGCLIGPWGFSLPFRSVYTDEFRQEVCDLV